MARQLELTDLDLPWLLEDITYRKEERRNSSQSDARTPSLLFNLNEVLRQKKMIEIHEEHPLDITPIRDVHIRAFGQSQEVEIVDQLRQNCNDLLSLVATLENQVVGHILFSPATIESQGRNVSGMALAPMAVLPEYQRQGIGSELVIAGLARLRNNQCPFVLVLGHAEFYPRFGFEPASLYGIRSEWEVPNEVFMILVLNEVEMKGISGVAKYRQEFDEAL